MQFNSITYAFFLPAVVLAFYVCPSRFRPLLLLASSYAFYASWDAIYLLLIVALTLLNYAIGLLMDRQRTSARQTLALLWIGVSVDLVALGIYKYSTFFVNNLDQVINRFALFTPLDPPNLVLPLALSFFTFEFVHYLVDVRRGARAVSSLLDFAVFACFFPTQVAGPIKRFEDFVPQITGSHRFDQDQFWSGVALVLIGLAKKAVLADTLAPQVALGFNRVAAGGALAIGDAWLAVVAFAFQIYFDFSGYTDMGRGSALMLGFNVPENFRRPYVATSISDFWRRWHISLSSWLRDYLYIPMGGNRGHRNRNLFITMVLGGLWHGANWTFVVWGMLHGLYLVGYWTWRTWRPQRARAAAWSATLPPVVGWAATFAVVLVGWVLFRAATFGSALRMLEAMVAQPGAATPMLISPLAAQFIVSVACGWLVVEFGQEWCETNSQRMGAFLQAWSRPLAIWKIYLRPFGYVVLLAFILLAKPDTGPRFIYFQF